MKTEMYCYLEDRDRAVLPGTEDFDRWLDPQRTAVACIDMHRGHVGDDEELTLPAPRARARIPAHNAFHRACREIGVPIIHVQHWQRHGGIDDLNSRHHNRKANWRVLYELYLPPNSLMDEHSWEGTKWLDIMIEESPEDYYVRTKKRLSGFYPTDLEFLLRQLDVANLVITGTFTDACDLSTAFSAADRDFRVIVPRDVVAGYSEEAEHAALMIVSLHLGLVVDAPALLGEWYARAGHDLPAHLQGITEISEAESAVETAAAVPQPSAEA
jgi:nicotinamidase-related amidase